MTNKTLNPENVDLKTIIDSLFENQHFNNSKLSILYFNLFLILVLGDLLSKKSATTKLERFFASKVKERLREL